MSYSHGNEGYGGKSNGGNPFEDRPPTEEERITGQILDVQQQSKGSTQRSLAMLMETEQIGVATASNLVEQGERLDHIEGTVKKIDADLKESQKNINGLKSVFGGITNWWQSKKDKKNPKDTIPEKEDSGLRKAMKQSEMGQFQNTTSSPAPTRPPPGGMTVLSTMEQNEADIEADLGKLSSPLNRSLLNCYFSFYISTGQMGEFTDRLKFMALAMGDEMEKQNDQLDRINDRVGRTDMTMSGQNKQMNKILKK